MTPPAQEIHSSPYLNVVGVGVVTGLDALSVAPPLVPYGHLGARWKWCVLLGGPWGCLACLGVCGDMRLGPQALCLDESFVQRSCGLVAGDFVGMAGRAAGESIACSLV